MERVKHFTRRLLPFVIGLALLVGALVAFAPSIAAWRPWNIAAVQSAAPRPPEPRADAAPRPPEPRADAAPRPAEPRADAAPRPPEPRPGPWGGWLWGWLLGTPHQWLSIALIVGGLWLLGRQKAQRPAQTLTSTAQPAALHPEAHQPPQEA